MPDDGDAIWRPDYDGPPPVVPSPPGVPPRSPATSAPGTGTLGHGAGTAGGSGGSDGPDRTDGPVGSVGTDGGTDRSDDGIGDAPGPPSPVGRRAFDRRALIAGSVTVAAAGGLAAWLLARPDPASDTTSDAVSDASDTASDGDSERATDSGDGSGSTSARSASARSDVDLVPFEPLDEPFVGADPRRLPTDPVLRWRRPLAFADDSQWTIGVVDRRFVVAISSPRLEAVGPSAIEVLDATSGLPVWGAASEGPAALHEVVGAIGGRLVIATPTDAESLVALDLTDGSVTWRRTAADVDLDAVGAFGRHELLPGTPLIARVPLVETDPTVLVDPATGSEVGRLDGVVVGTDHRGTWFLVRDGVVVAHDLADGWTPERRVGGTMSTDPAAKTVVVGGSVLTVLESRPGEFDPETVQIGIVEPDTLLLVDVDDPRRLGLDARVDVLTPLAGGRVLVLSGGRTTAAQLDGTSLTPAWTGDGLTIATAETVVGTFLVVSRSGGARNEIVDSRTGDTVDALTMTPGVFDALVLAGDGFVSRKSSPDGPRMAAIGLDGEEMWSLPGAAPVVVGDGVVARVEAGSDGIAFLSVHGSSSVGTAGGGVTQT